MNAFCSNLNLLLGNINDYHPTSSIFFGDFNAESLKYFYSNKTNRAGLELDIRATVGYSQLINEPIHYVIDTSSCTDLLFSDNTSLIRNCGIEHSIYVKCHHNIIFGTMNCSIPLPLPYYKEIQDYKNAEINSIQNAISNFDWLKSFKNRNTNANGKILTVTLMNNIYFPFIANFIPHETRKLGYETPKWMNKSVISSLKKRSKIGKIYYCNHSKYNKEGLINQANKYTQLILDAKEQNILKMSAKLVDPKTVPKINWTIPQIFKDIKTPIYLLFSLRKS